MYHARKSAAIGDKVEFRLRSDAAVERARSEGTALSVILCGLGAASQGDSAPEGGAGLRTAAEAVCRAVRPADEVVRLDERTLAVLLPGADELEAMEVAERVRGQVADSARDDSETVTATCGVSTLATEVGRHELFRAAGKALALGRQHGGNRTVAAAASGSDDEQRVVFAV